MDWVSFLHMCERVLPELLYVFHIFCYCPVFNRIEWYAHTFIYLATILCTKNPINKEKHVLGDLRIRGELSHSRKRVSNSDTRKIYKGLRKTNLKNKQILSK